jgi:PPOX class probable F420-dependent enzyme
MTAVTQAELHALIAGSSLGVLATLKADGRPQLSPVTPYYDVGAGVVYISITASRAKYANLRRDPRATLEVTSADGRTWATAEGVALLTGPGVDPRGPEVEALVDRPDSPRSRKDADLQVSAHFAWWPGAGSNRRPIDFQTVGRIPCSDTASV